MKELKHRTVVLWSGGTDSTILLHDLALKGPVVALSIADHMGASKMRFLRQARARQNYLKFAKKIGLKISYQEISVTGSAMLEATTWSDLNEPNRKSAILREWQVFIAWVLPFLRSGDRIYFGYEPYVNDYKSNRFNELLKTYTIIAGWDVCPSAHVLEYNGLRTDKLIAMIKRYKVPRNCFSSCDESLTLDDCNECGKCYSLNLAFKQRTLVFFD